MCITNAHVSKSFSQEKNRKNCFDNEKRNKQIVDRIEKAINKHFPVVIWPSDVKEKDINDMVLSGLDVDSMLKSNTYSGLEAKAKLISWKRV